MRAFTELVPDPTVYIIVKIKGIPHIWGKTLKLEFFKDMIYSSMRKHNYMRFFKKMTVKVFFFLPIKISELKSTQYYGTKDQSRS